MPLPLQDKKNPLYGLTIHKQCQVVIQWKAKGITPRQLLSLPQHYTQTQIKKAYRQLATVFHPDKNPGNQAAEEAFKIVAAACEYMGYGLMSGAERFEASNKIINNVFYQAYDEPRQSQASSQRPSANIRTYGAARRERTYEEMSYFELLFKMLLLPRETQVVPVRIVERLKRLILNDPTLINTYQPKIEGRSSTIGQIVASIGDFDFLIWLVDQGGDPRLMTTIVHAEVSKDIICLAIEKGNVRFLRYLLEQRGAQVFANEAGGNTNHQWWWVLKALIHRHFDVVFFLLEEVGFNRHINKQTLSSFNRCMDRLGCDLKHRGYSRPSTQQKKTLLQIAGLLLSAEEIPPEFLYYGIEWLLHVIEELSDEGRRYRDDHYLIKQEVFALVNQLIKQLKLEADDFSAIQADITHAIKPPEDKTERNTCTNKLYNGALRHGNYEVLEQLQAISVLPIINEYNRTRLLRRSLLSCSPCYVKPSPDISTQHDVETAYQKIITSLLDSDCFGTLDHGYTVWFYTEKSSPHDWTRKYKNYTLLHLACEAGWGEWALQLIDRMPNKTHGLNSLVTRRDLEIPQNDSPGKRQVYQYCFLHLAIQRGLTKVAVRLIEAGADITIKGIVDKTSKHCFSLFTRLQHTEQTPLEMAIEKQQPQVIRAIQRAMLENYIKQREQEEDYLSQFTLFGYVLFALGSFNLCGFIWGFGYSKSKKLEKARAFRELLDSDHFDKDVFEQFNEGAAQDGRLGEIVQLSDYYLSEEAFSNTTSLTI